MDAQKSNFGIEAVWSRRFDSDVSAVGISSDGVKMAVAIAPLCQSEDDNGGREERYMGRRAAKAEDNITCVTRAKLVYFEKFKQVWEQSFSTGTFISGLEISDDGAVVLAETRNIETDWKAAESFLFSGSGRVLWSGEGAAEYLSRGGGEAVIRQFDTYKFLQGGAVVWQKKTQRSRQEYEGPRGRGIRSSDGSAFYRDSGYFVLNRQIFDASGHPVEYYGGKRGRSVIGLYKNYAVLSDGDSLYGFNMLERAVSWTEKIENKNGKKCSSSEIGGFRGKEVDRPYIVGPYLVIDRCGFSDVYDVEKGVHLAEVGVDSMGEASMSSVLDNGRLFALAGSGWDKIYFFSVPQWRSVSYMDVRRRREKPWVSDIMRVFMQRYQRNYDPDLINYSVRYIALTNNTVLTLYDYQPLFRAVVAEESVNPASK